MTIDINPYADVLSFPPGTPPSVINAVLAIRARSDAQKAQQVDPWEQGINNIINGATNKLLFPWLQNEFVNLPYQTDLKTMETDQAIRAYEAQQGYLTGQEKQRLLDKLDVTNQGLSQLGGAIDQFGNYSKPTPESFFDSGPTTPYGPYEDPQYSSPGPQYSPPLNNMGNVAPDSNTGANIQDLISQQSAPTQLQGDIAPTGRDRIMTYSPANQPTIADSLKAMAGSGTQGTLNAGLMAQLLEKPGMLGVFDPLKLQEREQALRVKNAEEEYKRQQTAGMAAKLPGELGLLDARQQEVMARSGLIYGQDEMNRLRLGVLRDIQSGEVPSQALLRALKMEGHDPMSAPTLTKLTLMSKMMSPDDPMKAVFDSTIKDLNQYAVTRNIQTAQGTLAPAAAKTEAFTTQREIAKTKQFLMLADKVLPAIDLADQAGILPKSTDVRDQYTAFKHQALSREAAKNFPGLNSAMQMISQFYGALDVATVRGIGDQAARIKAAYGLPEKPLMLTKDQLYTVVNLFRTMAQESQDDNIQRLLILNDQVGGNPVIMGPYGNMSPSGGGSPISGKTPPPGYRMNP